MFSDIEKTAEIGQALQSFSYALLMLALIGLMVLALAYIRHRTNQKKQERKVPVTSIAFADHCFGMLADAPDKETGLRQATVFDASGNELCRYEEAQGQTILGFSSESGVLYMHTTETYEDGTTGPMRWMFMPENNEFVECDNNE